MRILVTGGAGFIGSAVIRHIINNTEHSVINVDALTYAGNLESLKEVEDNNRYTFVQANVSNIVTMQVIFDRYKPESIIHLAAESHVDRSIDNSIAFINTNILGTYTLLECARKYYNNADEDIKDKFKFLHVSTDEVYGSLGDEGLFTEETPYDPRSPYSASKASSDHLVMAWYHTYGLPTVITNCSNNYGPYQFPEKLIPLVLLNAMEEKELPIYGKGDNIRDWLYVEDHAYALLLALKKGKPGEKYNIGGMNERTNLKIVKTICKCLDEIKPRKNGKKYEELIVFVKDRPAHDRRYAIDATKIRTQLGWKPNFSFNRGLNETIKWYINNEWWWKPIRETNYNGQRLGEIKIDSND